MDETINAITVLEDTNMTPHKFMDETDADYDASKVMGGTTIINDSEMSHVNG